MINYIYANLKTAKHGAAVGDSANRAGKSKKADAGKDVAVDELPGDGDDEDDGSDGDVHIYRLINCLDVEMSGGGVVDHWWHVMSRQYWELMTKAHIEEEWLLENIY